MSFIYFFHGGGWGPNAVQDLVRAMTEQGTFAIDDYVKNTGDWAKVNGYYYSAKNAGAAFFAAPIHFLLISLFHRAYDSFSGAQAIAHVTIGLTFSLLAAFTAALFYLWLRRFASRQAALFTAIIAWLGTVSFAYGSMFSAQILVSSCYVICVFALWQTADREKANDRSTFYPLLAGFVLGWAILSEPIAVFGAAVFGVVMLLLRLSRRAWLFVVLGGLPPALLLVVYNTICFGSPFTTAYLFQNPAFVDHNAAAMGVLNPPSLKILFFITFHPYRGLFWVSPVLLLSLWGLCLSWRSKPLRVFLVLCTGMIFSYGLFNISYGPWDGGWCVGPRYLVSVMPFFVAPLALVFDSKTWLRKLVLGLGVISVLVQLAVTAVNPSPPRLQGVSNPLTGSILANLKLNLVSVNNYNAFPLHDRPIAQFWTLGSFEEWWASYNLGELMGYGGILSLAPLVFVWIVGFVVATRLLRGEPN